VETLIRGVIRRVETLIRGVIRRVEALIRRVIRKVETLIRGVTHSLKKVLSGAPRQFFPPASCDSVFFKSDAVFSVPCSSDQTCLVVEGFQVRATNDGDDDDDVMLYWGGGSRETIRICWCN
jgi:hypothetical protein